MRAAGRRSGLANPPSRCSTRPEKTQGKNGAHAHGFVRVVLRDGLPASVEGQPLPPTVPSPERIDPSMMRRRTEPQGTLVDVPSAIGRPSSGTIKGHRNGVEVIGVNVERHRCGGVPEHPLHGLHVGARTYGKAGGSVPQIVDSHRLEAGAVESGRADDVTKRPRRTSLTGRESAHSTPGDPSPGPTCVRGCPRERR